MPRFSFSSLRVRLILLVLLAVLPALVLVVYTGLQQRRHAAQEAQKHALMLARNTARLQESLIDETRSLLFTLAQIHEFHQHDTSTCSAIFAKLRTKLKQYAAFNAIGLDGLPFAGDPPITAPVSFADREWFQRTLATKDFVVSEYFVGRRTGKPSLGFSCPVVDAAGEVKAVLMAALELEWLHRFWGDIDLPVNISLTLVDHQGTILVHYPGLPELIGAAMPEAPIVKAMLSQGEGVAEAPGLDGVERLYGFTSLGPKTGELHLSVGLPTDDVFAGVRRGLIINLAGLGLVALLAVAAAWWGGNAFILRQTDALLRVSRRLGAGDLTAYAGPPYGKGELGQLAEAFDHMAESVQKGRQGLEQKVAERTTELQQSNELLVKEVAERQKAEQILARQALELARSNADLEQFAYVASHDLQEPLRIIDSYLQLLARRYRGQLDADSDKFIDRAIEGTARMKALINDLLVYARLGVEGKPLAPTDCQAVCRAALANLKVALEETGAEVVCQQLPTLMADASQLTQLFQNLIGNAVKFHGEEAPRVEISAQRNGHEWVFAVRDNGIGMEPEYLDRIFRVFQRLHTRAEYPGTGVGLAICRKIVERHGGRIWADSEPGRGSTLYFTLPDQKGERT
jgi:signal transduction histidine kinase